MDLSTNLGLMSTDLGPFVHPTASIVGTSTPTGKFGANGSILAATSMADKVIESYLNFSSDKRLNLDEDVNENSDSDFCS